MRGAKRALLLTAVVPLLLMAPPAAAHGAGPVRVYLVDVEFEEALRDPTLRSIAASGGIGLLAESAPSAEVVADLRAASVHGDVTVTAAPSTLHIARDVAEFRPPEGSGPFGRQLLVLAFSPSAEPGSGVVVMGYGAPGELLGVGGPVPGLTSATTRQPGLVSNVDLVATVLNYLGHPDPAAAGTPIEAEGFEPTELHSTHEGYRRVAIPVGVAVLVLAAAALLAGLAIAAGVWMPPPPVGRAVAVAGLFAVSLQVAMLPGSWLSEYSWPAVVGTLLGVGAVVTAAALSAGRRLPHAAVVTVAVAGAAMIVVDWLLGWRSLLTPLLGGSAFDGVRFHGLGNPYAGVLVAGLVLGAALLRPVAGVVVLVAGAFFAGSPWTGADLGGGITLFAAAAIWWALAVRRRMGATEALGVVAAAVGGAVVLVLLHRVATEATHVSRAVEEGGMGVVGTFLDRLVLNLETTAGMPAVWPALAGVALGTVAAWRRWPAFELAFRGHPLWRPATLTLGLAAITGYLVNDTYGLTAVACVYLSLALVYPATLEKMFGRNGKNPQTSKPRGFTLWKFLL